MISITVKNQLYFWHQQPNGYTTINADKLLCAIVCIKQIAWTQPQKNEEKYELWMYKNILMAMYNTKWKW